MWDAEGGGHLQYKNNSNSRMEQSYVCVKIAFCSSCKYTHSVVHWLSWPHDGSHTYRHTITHTVTIGDKTTLTASSNTSFMPFRVRAEHSTYFTAPIFSVIFTAAENVIGSLFNLDSFSSVCASPLKSILNKYINNYTKLCTQY